MTLEQANAYITGLSGEVLAEAAKILAVPQL